MGGGIAADTDASVKEPTKKVEVPKVGADADVGNETEVETKSN